MYATWGGYQQKSIVKKKKLDTSRELLVSSSALETDISVSLPAGIGNLVDICASLTLGPGQIFGLIFPSFTKKYFQKS